MSDRELLDLAARAVGGELLPTTDGYPYWAAFKETPPGPWNPLEDGGDAFRLMAELRIDVVFDGESTVQAIYTDRSFSFCVFEQAIQEDVAANIRLAIVNAAAEIGRNTP